MFQIVVLRGGALGDIILTLPVLAALRAYYPGCSLTFVAPYPQAILARGYANRLLDLNSASLVGLFTPDTALPEDVRTSLKSDLVLTYLSDPEKVTENRLIALGVQRFLQGPFKLDLERRPAVVQLARPLQVLGIVIDPVPRLNISPSGPPLRRLAIHPGSGSPDKNWPLHSWVKLLAELAPAFAEVLVVSGEADSQNTEAILPLIPKEKLRLCANRSLWDLVSELSRANLFIGHDSGVTHVAAATGIRTVALFGPTDPTIWAPIGDQVTVIQSPDRSMSSLNVDAVLDRLELLPKPAPDPKALGLKT